MNYIINGSGGAVSLDDNPPALRRWLVVCPKVATMIVENEDDETRSHQKKQRATALVEDGSPFPEEIEDLLVLDTRYITNVPV